jgi:hypothetical protein
MRLNTFRCEDGIKAPVDGRFDEDKVDEVLESIGDVKDDMLIEEEEEEDDGRRGASMACCSGDMIEAAVDVCDDDSAATEDVSGISLINVFDFAVVSMATSGCCGCACGCGCGHGCMAVDEGDACVVVGGAVAAAVAGLAATMGSMASME